MQGDIERVMIDRDAIGRRLDELAAQIAADLDDVAASDPCEITLVPILTGSIIFVSDLIRRLPLKMQIHLISVSSYPGTATTSQGARVEQALTRLPDSLAGRNVLLIDDILDSGHTLRLVTQELRQRGPASLHTCVLLRKGREAAMNTPVDYVAFDIPDEFIVGYGLDYDGYYRNLPDIVSLKRQVFA
jgi:hypoxanthine phosphoribosyltransferase